MKANVICLASSKGGSGKTTITATLGTFLNEIGKRVLMVDCDEGTHGLTLMYLNEVNENRKQTRSPRFGVFDDVGKIPRDIVAQSIVWIKPGLALFPARHIFSEVDIPPVDESFKSNLLWILESAAEGFDYVLLDAQAGISTASRAAMSPEVSDTVILVSEYDPMSNAGVERMKARLPDELDISRTWMLLNKLLPEFISKFSEFLSVAKYLPPVPWTADVVRAYSRRKLALDFQGGNQFTLAILNILRELLPEIEKGDLEAWTKAQSERVREPISEQLADSENLLRQLRELEAAQGRAHGRKLRLMLAASIAGLSIVLIASIFSQYFENLFGSAISASVLLVVGSIFLYGFWITLYSELRDGGSRTKQDYRADRYALTKRVNELRDLSNANYDEIIKSKWN